MMGIWFVGAALGNLFAGLVGGRLESMEPDALFPERGHDDGRGRRVRARLRTAGEAVGGGAEGRGVTGA